MIGGALGDEVHELVGPREVARQGVADDDGEEQEDAVLHHALADLHGGPWSGFQRATFPIVAVDPAFDAAKDALEKHRLRTRPPAPQAAQGGGDDEEAETNARQHEEQQGAVLGVERQPKEVK